jgi:glycogen operon protein
MLALLFLSRGTPMLTAGDEFGRTQRGNNNAYAQDNEMVWLNWTGRDPEIEEHVAVLADLRRRFAALRSNKRLNGQTGAGGIADVAWLGIEGRPLEVADWENPALDRFAMVLATGDPAALRIAFLFNRSSREVSFRLDHLHAKRWQPEQLIVRAGSVGVAIEST